MAPLHRSLTLRVLCELLFALDPVPPLCQPPDSIPSGSWFILFKSTGTSALFLKTTRLGQSRHLRLLRHHLGPLSLRLTHMCGEGRCSGLFQGLMQPTPQPQRSPRVGSAWERGLALAWPIRPCLCQSAPTHHTLRRLSNSDLFRTVLEAGRRDQGTGIVGCISSRLAGGCLFAVSSHGRERRQALWCLFL